MSKTCRPVAFRAALKIADQAYQSLAWVWAASAVLLELAFQGGCALLGALVLWLSESLYLLGAFGKYTFGHLEQPLSGSEAAIRHQYDSRWMAVGRPGPTEGDPGVEGAPASGSEQTALNGGLHLSIVDRPQGRWGPSRVDYPWRVLGIWPEGLGDQERPFFDDFSPYRESHGEHFPTSRKSRAALWRKLG